MEAGHDNITGSTAALLDQGMTLAAGA